MGGEAAKERRRLKRLEAATTSTPSMEKKSDDAPIQQTIKNGEKSNADTLLRFKRKMARKASGKFKPQSQGQSDDVTSHNNKLSPAKRKSEEYTNNNRRTATYPPSKKAFKGSPRQDQQSYQQQKKPPFKRNNNNANNSTSPRYNKKDNSKQSPKKKNTTQKVKKPKHLKRKMDQLSKTISEGNKYIFIIRKTT